MASNERGDVSDPVTREEIDAVAGDELDVREQLVRARRSCVRLSDLHEAAEKRADAAERALADVLRRVRVKMDGGDAWLFIENAAINLEFSRRGPIVQMAIRAAAEAVTPEGGSDAG